MSSTAGLVNMNIPSSAGHASNNHEVASGDAGLEKKASVEPNPSSPSALSTGKVRLKKELRLVEAVSVIVGLIVGTGMLHLS